MKKILFIIAGVSVIVGCASAPSREQLESGDYGADLSSQECESIVKTHVLSRLKDPDSAKFRFDSACEKGYVSSAPLLGREAQLGWRQTGFVNAKNSFGGYTGFNKFEALMRDGEVVSFCFESRAGHCFPE